MTVLVDPNWQEAATDNARRGFHWAVWGRRTDVDMPLGLLDSKATKADAERFADYERTHLRPVGKWTVIVIDESQP